ncbi:DUF962 domain-containing protein [Shewanella sp. AS1]|uniref:DUF962 domain-containing protein n=1 Tax=Shewanella sp. AS1 TaxID=2907626 RepID=UPI001F2C3636|nr:DUF962 domain-containing protein [Shewanella sp. AS1]MCE9678149.1 DUF962 domain-containing protein [Shewanella sp. AS1]
MNRERVQDNKAVNQYRSFKAFYPFYLSQHQQPACRAMHYLGSTLVLGLLLLSLWLQNGYWLLLMPVAGYGCAWIGHFMFEHNRPATFTHPLYSLYGDWVMYAQWLGSLFKSK